MSLKKCEVLSPAGSFEGLVAAVRSGADAVYLGAKEFSARRNAQNFDEKQLKESVEFCHIRGVKVYLTLNIMLKNTELQRAIGVVEYAYSCGIDGIITADLGLAMLIHTTFPNLPLHASTQMTVHSPAALYELKELGFKRVVAAREMSKASLKELCQKAEELDMEIEAFVHGALCMCVSGQCLLSSVIGTRSGNRGLCAGPCRLPFKVSGGTGYDLSLKDLSLYDYITELKEMGVSSFKIEGRMKRPEYIAAATRGCAEALNQGYVSTDLKEALHKVFTRSGFTDGYYKEKLGRDMFGVRTEDDADISKEAFSYIHNIYRAERQNVGIKLSVEIIEQRQISLTATDGKNTVTLLGEKPQAALNRAATKEDIEKLISKLGGTPYFAEEINVRIGEGLFVAAGEINGLRREAIKMLSALRAKPTQIEKAKPPQLSFENKASTLQKRYARINDISQLCDDLSFFDLVFVPLYIAECQEVQSLKNKALELPRWIENEEKLFLKLLKLKEQGYNVAYCSNLSAINLAKKAGFKIVGGIGLNVCNDYSAKVFYDMDTQEVTLSAEMGMGEAKALSLKGKKGIFAYGRLPLMIFKNCPVKNGADCRECKQKGFITDRKGIKFPIRCRDGYSEMFNCSYLYLADKNEDIKDFDFLLFYFTDETIEQIEEIIENYQTAAPPTVDYTRGLYYRKLL